MEKKRRRKQILYSCLLVLVDGDQVVAGHSCQPDVDGLISQHLIVDGLSLLVPSLALGHIAALEFDDAHLVLPGGLLGAGEVPHVVEVAPSVVGLLVDPPSVHSSG